jgi:hypothetical protein
VVATFSGSKPLIRRSWNGGQGDSIDPPQALFGSSNQLQSEQHDCWKDKTEKENVDGTGDFLQRFDEH